MSAPNWNSGLQMSDGREVHLEQSCFYMPQQGVPAPIPPRAQPSYPNFPNASQPPGATGEHRYVTRGDGWFQLYHICVNCHTPVELPPGLPTADQTVYCTPCHTELVARSTVPSLPAPMSAPGPGSTPPLPQSAPAPPPASTVSSRVAPTHVNSQRKFIQYQPGMPQPPMPPRPHAMQAQAPRTQAPARVPAPPPVRHAHDLAPAPCSSNPASQLPFAVMQPSPSNMQAPPHSPAVPPPWAHLSLTHREQQALHTAASFLRAAAPFVYPAHRHILAHESYWRQFDPAWDRRERASEVAANALESDLHRVSLNFGGRGSGQVPHGVQAPPSGQTSHSVRTPHSGQMPQPPPAPQAPVMPQPKADDQRRPVQSLNKRKRPKLQVRTAAPPSVARSSPKSASISARSGSSGAISSSTTHRRTHSLYALAVPSPLSAQMPASPAICLCASFDCGAVLGPEYAWTVCPPCLSMVDRMPATSPVRAGFVLEGGGATQQPPEVRLSRSAQGGVTISNKALHGMVGKQSVRLGLQERRLSAVRKEKGGMPVRKVSLSALAVGSSATAGDQDRELKTERQELPGKGAPQHDQTFARSPSQMVSNLPKHDEVAGSVREAAPIPQAPVASLGMAASPESPRDVPNSPMTEVSPPGPGDMIFTAAGTDVSQPMEIDPPAVPQPKAEQAVKVESPSARILPSGTVNRIPTDDPSPQFAGAGSSDITKELAMHVTGPEDLPLSSIAIPRLPTDVTMMPFNFPAFVPLAQASLPRTCSTEGCANEVPPDSRFGRCVNCGLSRLKARFRPISSVPKASQQDTKSKAQTVVLKSAKEEGPKRSRVLSVASTSSLPLKENDAVSQPSYSGAGLRLKIKLKTPRRTSGPLKDVPSASHPVNMVQSEPIALDGPTSDTALFPTQVPEKPQSTENVQPPKKLVLRIPARSKPVVMDLVVKQEPSSTDAALAQVVHDEPSRAPSHLEDSVRDSSVDSQHTPLSVATSPTKIVMLAPTSSASSQQEASIMTHHTEIFGESPNIQDHKAGSPRINEPGDDEMIPIADEDLFSSDAIDDELIDKSVDPSDDEVESMLRPRRVFLKLSTTRTMSPGSPSPSLSTTPSTSAPSSQPRQASLAPLDGIPVSSSLRETSDHHSAEPSIPRAVHVERDVLSAAALTWDGDESELTPLEDSSESDSDADPEQPAFSSSEEEPLAAKLPKPRLVIKLKRKRGRPPIHEDSLLPQLRTRCRRTGCQNIVAPGWRWRKCSIHRIPKPEDEATKPPLPPGYRLCKLRGCETALPPMSQYKWKLCEDCRLLTRERERERKRRQSGGHVMTFERQGGNLRQQRKKRKSTAVESTTHQDIPAHLQLKQYQHFGALLDDLCDRFRSFLFAHTQYLRLKLATQTVPNPVLFAFDGEYSVVANPSGGAVDPVVERVMQAIGTAVGIIFVKTRVSKAQDATIVTTYSCTHDVLVPLLEPDPSEKTETSPMVPSQASNILARRMIGEVDVAVSWDRTHPFIPGQRIALRFHAVG